MNRPLLVRVLLCIALLGFLLYGYISKQNAITELRLKIPKAAQEVEAIEQENIRLQFLVDQWANPRHLMELSRLPQFSHLKYPTENETIVFEISK